MKANFFDLNKFFNWSRLVDPAPKGDWQFLWWAVGFGAGLIVLAIIRAFLAGDRSLKHKTEGMLWIIGLVGLVLTFFRWQQIPYFSARILWLALAIWFIAWIAIIIYYRLVKIPKKILLQKVKERKNKYL